MTPLEIFHRMFDNDPFSRWMGMELVSVGPGACTLRMAVREEMLNGFGVAHGGITFSLADSAFAFACNSHGLQAVSVHCTIEHVAPVRAGDVLTAAATEEILGNSLSNYAIRVERADGTPVAFFRGMAYRKKREWT
ncbi:MAG: hydroxyphenylacetyl-CoA thioesterase PaaI [Saprospirales bacterium]|jgi:acyl-CoA thioesterase|nr:hydroxyphenylacetyl-CoA thioesterase PaaI [Saprospirales bacterium]MBK8922623.1 hydroxyphenylacetyl-CoA thioesterase PaaI [Saprospirales bacterium]